MRIEKWHSQQTEQHGQKYEDMKQHDVLQVLRVQSLRREATGDTIAEVDQGKDNETLLC